MVYFHGVYVAMFVGETQVEALDAYARSQHYRDFTALVIDRADPDREMDCQSVAYQTRLAAIEAEVTVKKAG
jgi:hypothetical protein